MKKGKIFIGTSGWHYEHWREVFYPQRISSKNFFRYYKEVFSTVEINRTFYSLPKRKVFSTYAKMVSPAFIFSVKASRFITHVKKLKDPKSSLKRLFSCILGLGAHLGPILFQLPPQWKINPERLHSFLQTLPKEHRYVFEFRDQSWLTEEIYALLKKYNAAFCIYELGDVKTARIITADFLYIRLHGPKFAYGGSYSLQELRQWARFFRKEAKRGKDIYCYFDNDERGFAANNAKTLQKLLLY